MNEKTGASSYSSLIPLPSSLRSSLFESAFRSSSFIRERYENEFRGVAESTNRLSNARLGSCLRRCLNSLTHADT